MTDVCQFSICVAVLHRGRAVPLRHKGNWTADRGLDKSFAKSRRRKFFGCSGMQASANTPQGTNYFSAENFCCGSCRHMAEFFPRRGSKLQLALPTFTNLSSIPLAKRIMRGASPPLADRHCRSDEQIVASTSSPRCDDDRIDQHNDHLVTTKIAVEGAARSQQREHARA
jgi:hypothetical protein